MEGEAIKHQVKGAMFPIKIFEWNKEHKYVGEEITHLWFSNIVGAEAYGNIVFIWRGPMDVTLENVKDQTERVEWKAGTRIRGPDLYHVVADFPQIAGDLKLMYAFQSMLAKDLALGLCSRGLDPEVKGSDIFIEGEKLNVGVCTSTANSCNMHFGVNVTLNGEPSIPVGVRASSLTKVLGQDADASMALMREVIISWAESLENLVRKSYKTV